MKLPKTTNRHCPYCKKHTEHKISQASTGHKRGTLKRGSKQRARKRGLGRGYGNLGKWGSKPAVTKFKRKIKSTKKTNTMYTCKTCKKSHMQKKGIRTSKVQIEAKGAKK
jgi:large subunit ribosomal protein L44e